MSNELKQRLLISVIGIPFLIWLFYTGGLILMIGLGLLTAIGTWEYRKILFKDNPVWLIVDIVLAICVYLSACMLKEKLCPSCSVPNWAYIAFFFVLQSIAWLGRKAGERGIKDYLLTIWGLFYIAILSGVIFRIDAMYDNHLLLVLLILIWITDCSAYFIGMRFGKRRGIFPMSPNKSMEGFIAGLLGPLLFAFITYFVYPVWKIEYLLIAAISAGLFGQLGDLLESKIKRIGGVKDSSNLIPGHGGILDRFDSLLIAGPVMYCLLTLIP